MFYITPTPLSWILWAIIWAISVLLIFGIGTFAFFKEKKWAYVLCLLILLVPSGLSLSSYYHNYSRSASYKMKARNMEIEYDNNISRTLMVYDLQGKVIYSYTGEFSFTQDGKKISTINTKSGKKMTVVVGDNDTYTITDKGF